MDRLHKIPVLTILLSISSGVVGSLIGAYAGYVVASQQLNALREQNEILHQSLKKEVNLVMTVVPSADLTIIGDGNVTIRNSTLTVSRTQEFPFKIYVSNVGTAFAHLLYYSVIINLDTNHTITSVYSIDTIVMKPSESTSFDYMFSPSHIPSEMVINTSYLNLTFIVGSAEMSVYEVINAQFGTR